MVEEGLNINCIVNKEGVKKFISSFKKNSWLAQTMFASDISEIVIKRNVYNFELNMYIPNYGVVDIPFHYKPNKRKRKKKNNNIVKNDDSGYETNIDDYDKVEKINEEIDKNSITKSNIDENKINKIDGINEIYNENKLKNNDDIIKNPDAHRKVNIENNKKIEIDNKKEEEHAYILFGDHKTRINNNIISIPFSVGNCLYEKKKLKKYNYIYNLLQNIISKLTLLNDIIPKTHPYFNTFENIMFIIVNSVLEIDFTIKKVLIN
jgi:hypothetical protein